MNDPRDFLNEAPVINRFPQILLPTFLFQPSDGRHFCRGGTTPAGQIFQKDTPRYSHASIQAHDINNRINNRRNRRSATASGKKLMRAGFVARVLEPSTNHLRRRPASPSPHAPSRVETNRVLNSDFLMGIIFSPNYSIEKQIYSSAIFDNGLSIDRILLSN